MRESYLEFFVAFLLAYSFFPPGAAAQTNYWTKLAGPYQGNLSTMVVDRQGYIYVADQFNGVYRSTDAGSSWTQVNNGLTWENLASLQADSAGAVYGGSVFSGLFRTTDNGASWTKTNLSGGASVARILSGDRLCVGGVDTVSISTDQGRTWRSARVGDTTVYVISLAEDKAGNIYAGLQAVFPRNSSPYGGGIYVSSDSGKTWQYNGLNIVSITAIAVSDSGRVFLSNGGTVFSAPPRDTNWVQNAIGLPHSGVNLLSNTPSGDVVAAIGGGLYVYDDSTVSWNLVPGHGLSSTTISGFYYDPKGMSYAVTDRNGVFRMTNAGDQWRQCGIFTTPATAVACDKAGNLYVGTNDGIYVPGGEAGIWIRASDGLREGRVYGIDTVSTDSSIYATTTGGVFYSKDDGESWTITTSRWTYALTEGPPGTILIGTTGGVLASTQGGLTWSTLTNIGFPISTIYSLLWSDGRIFAGTSNNGVFETTTGGKFWVQTGISSPFMFYSVRALAQAKTQQGIGDSAYVSDGPIYAGTDSAGAFYTSDSGQNWVHIPSITASDISCFLFTPSLMVPPGSVTEKPMFAGTLDGGVFVSTDGGVNWSTVNDGLADSSVSSLAIDKQGFLYAATDGGVYETTSAVTAIVPRPQSRPAAFSLDQNYPNPFNPTTAISYRLPAYSHVALKVYDILGREVETLVNGMQNSGSHTVTVDGSKLASGVYFYRLEVIPESTRGEATKPFIETKKMVLVK